MKNLRWFLVAVMLLISSAGRAESVNFTFDPTGGSGFPEGLRFWFTDYPLGFDIQHDLQLGVKELPEDATKGGLYFAGLNRSDDLNTNVLITLTQDNGVRPSQKYSVKVTLNILSNTPSGLIGVGGGPDAVVFSLEHHPSVGYNRDVDSLGYWRNSDILFIEKNGYAPVDSRYQQIGDIGIGSETPKWTPIVRTGVVEARSDLNSRLQILISTHSGFESFTEFYYTGITVEFTPLK